MFKSRLGPLKVFEAGEFHTIKGFKVAVCSYQIESRKVLARDNLKVQTAVPPTKSKKTQPTGGAKNSNHPKEVNDGSKVCSVKGNVKQTSYISGKGSHLDSTVNTRTPSYPEFSQSQEHFDSDHYQDRSMFGECSVDHTDVPHELLLKEVMQEIEELEASNLVSPAHPHSAREKTNGHYLPTSNYQNHHKPQFGNTIEAGYGTSAQYQDPYYASYDYYEKPSRPNYLSHQEVEPVFSLQGKYCNAPEGESFAEPGMPPTQFRKKHGPSMNGWMQQIESEDPPLLLWHQDDQSPHH